MVMTKSTMTVGSKNAHRIQSLCCARFCAKRGAAMVEPTSACNSGTVLTAMNLTSGRRRAEHRFRVVGARHAVPLQPSAVVLLQSRLPHRC
jgi:hypothetical protein